MSAEIVKFNLKLSKAEQFADALIVDGPEEIVAIGYKEGTYYVYSMGDIGLTRTLGALEIIKFELFQGEWE